MSEERRHSLDIPISRALVALRRVRSLRDPETNSLSKLAALVDHMNLEASPQNDTIYGGIRSSRHHFSPNRTDHLEGRRVGDLETNILPCRRAFAPDNICIRCACAECSLKNAQTHQSFPDHMPRLSNLNRVSQYGTHFEGKLGLGDDLRVTLPERESISSVKKSKHCQFGRPDSLAEAATIICSGSPCAPPGEVSTNISSHSGSELETEEIDFGLYNGNSCGNACLWTKVQNCKVLNPLSGVQDLEQELVDTVGKHICDNNVPYQCNLRTRGEKYKPRFFHQLVGQKIIVDSLVTSILKESIAPIYFFHGPRGTGKTSAARIFAAALNCLSSAEKRPCGSCQECTLFFSGRTKDVRELDVSEVNHMSWGNTLLNSFSLDSSSSCFKVYIIDDCQFLDRSSWAVICKRLAELPQRVVFIMITSDLDKLPSNVISWCKKYHFPRIKDADIIHRLGDICMEEELDFDVEALVFIASKSNGSIREAVTMLEQLSLLGQKITISLAYELAGVVSDDELLELLHVALSSDIPTTVRRSRELMRTKIDPLQLTSQLANVIMDIIAGRCKSESSRVIAGTGIEKLKHALKVLSEVEKQLRTSKNQSTWLTAALLELGTTETFSVTDMNQLNACERMSYLRDDELPTAVSPKNRSNDSFYRPSNGISNLEKHCDRARELKGIWTRVIDNCSSSLLKELLHKEGKLSSIHEHEGRVVVEIEFSYPEHVAMSEKSRISISKSFQVVLGCDVDLRIGLVPTSECEMPKKPSFCLLSCSSRRQEACNEHDTANVRMQKPPEVCSIHHSKNLSLSMQELHDSGFLHNGASHRETEMNTLSRQNSLTRGSVQDDISKRRKADMDTSKVRDRVQRINVQRKHQSRCFGRNNRFRRSFPANTTDQISSHKKKMSISKKTCFGAMFCCKHSGCLCFKTNKHAAKASKENRPSSDSRLSRKPKCCQFFRCIQMLLSSFPKARQKRRQASEKSQFVSWILPCTHTERDPKDEVMEHAHEFPKSRIRHQHELRDHQ